MKRAIMVLFFSLAAAGSAQVPADKPLLLQNPTINGTQIVFVYAGDLWIVSREGGDAKQLTTGVGNESDPIFSPDGTQIAFTGEYDGNVDVFIVPASGGVPRRLTYHPGPDVVLGWTRDGKQILFRSRRNSYSFFSRPFTVPLDGVFPTELPLPMAEEASYSPDGSRVAYVPLARSFQAWKRYRGGRTTPLWLAKLSDSSIEKVPRDNSNDFEPMWVDNQVYFLSDRNGPVTLFAYDTLNKKVTQVLANDGLDIKSAAAGGGAIVYEQFGTLHLLDLKTRKPKKLDIRLAGDMPSVRPVYDKVATRIRSARLSPTGARAVVEARGEILTVPAEKGDIRNLTESGAAERDPAWSSDGKRIAYFSDESGEYALHLREQTGQGEVKKIQLGNPPSYFYSPVWSPDSKKIAYVDKRLQIWYVDLEKGTPVCIDTDPYATPFSLRIPVWSHDSKWLAYTRQLRNYFRAVFVHSLETGKNTQLTDGMSDARFVAFDKNGEYLYFMASTDVGPTSGGGEMSNVNRQVTRSVYVTVLRKDRPSPLAPESDEEKGPDAAKSTESAGTKPDDKPAGSPEEKPKEKEKEAPPVRIDFENVSQRILALPIPARDYSGLFAGKTGVLYILENLPPSPGTPPPGRTLHKWDLKTRKVEKVLDGISTFDLSHNGEKMIYRQGERWAIQATKDAPKPGEGTLKLDTMEVRVDPRAEWKQIYREVWRIERDFFYDPGFHGLDLKAAEKKYEPYLENIASRGDLNYLFAEMLGEMSVGHMFVGGGALPEVKRVRGGLLGADYAIENGRYRFARVYSGENWNPQLRAPLTQPGVNVEAGEYLLAVNAKDLRASDNLYKLFEGTAGKSVVLRVGTDPGGVGSREVTVVPVEDEVALRNRAWIEDNRRKVDKMTGGRVAYVYVPDTSFGGYTNFNRYYFAQVGKEAVVVDERFNGGGLLADYIINYLDRPLSNYVATREGADVPVPQAVIYGPKAMIVNEYAGSGGDAMPYYFRQRKLGPLIGKRTWGGLVGISGAPPLIDGGFLTAPNLAIWFPNGQWDVENRGVAPDIEVEHDPQAVRAGRDPQLEKAVEVVLETLRKNPPPVHKRPAYPNYHSGSKRLTTANR